jgi:hypothetical protein
MSHGLANVKSNNIKAYQGVPMLVFVLLEDFFPPPPLIPKKSGAAQFQVNAEHVYRNSVPRFYFYSWAG